MKHTLLRNTAPLKVTKVHDQQIKNNGDSDSDNSVEMTRMPPNHGNNLSYID